MCVFVCVCVRLTGWSGAGGLVDVCQGSVGCLLGLVPMLSQKHKADLVPQIWNNQAILDLTLHNLI